MQIKFKFKKIFSIIIMFISLFLIGCNVTSELSNALTKCIELIPTETSQDLIFIENYGDIVFEYSSSDTSVIDNSGKVYPQENGEFIVVTVTAKNGTDELSKDVIIYVMSATVNLETVIQNAINEVNSFFDSLDRLNYTEDNYSLIINYKNQVLDNLNLVKSEEVVASLVQQFKNNVLAVETLGVDVTEKLENIFLDLDDVISLDKTIVSTDLNLKKESLYDSTITWEISDETIISLDGKIAEDAPFTTVNIKFTVTLDGQVYDGLTISVFVGTEDVNELLLDIVEDLFDILEKDLTIISENLDLRTTSLYNSTIIWSISDETIISKDGVLADNVDLEEVEISFDILLDDVVYEGLTILVYVDTNKVDEKLEDIIYDLSDVLSLDGKTITSDLNLKTKSLYDSTITWFISDETVISQSGKVSADITRKEVRISFNIDLDGESYEGFAITVIVNTAKTDVDLPTYYDGISTSLTGNSLKLALRNLLVSTKKRSTTYEQLKTYLAQSDVDPARSGYLITVYSRKSVSAKWDGGSTWNREHVWPQSKGWFTTSGAGSDIHHIRPELPSVNSSRGNKAFTESGSGYIPDADVRGDIARILFYLLTAYSESDRYNITTVATSMSMLLKWNEQDPVDEYEIRRNEVSYSIQGNRNPFIDYSEYANIIWDYSNATLSMLINDATLVQITKNYVIIEDISDKKYYI